MKIFIEPNSYHLTVSKMNGVPVIGIMFERQQTDALVEKLFRPAEHSVTVRVGANIIDDETLAIEEAPKEEDEEFMELAIYCRITVPKEIELPCKLEVLDFETPDTTEYMIGAIMDLPADRVCQLMLRYREHGFLLIALGYTDSQNERQLFNLEWSTFVSRLEHCDEVFHDFYTRFRLKEQTGMQDLEAPEAK